jgi:hypothetical protein
MSPKAMLLPAIVADAISRLHPLDPVTLPAASAKVDLISALTALPWMRSATQVRSSRPCANAMLATIKKAEDASGKIQERAIGHFLRTIFHQGCCA